MRLAEVKIEAINNRLTEKKRENRIDNNTIGIGIKLSDGLSGTSVVRNYSNMGWTLCDIDDLARTIEELTMLKEAIEEETGLILK